MHKNILPYSQARHLIDEADVLLFRSKPWKWHKCKYISYPVEFPSVGWFISAYTRGIHSHVGLAHWDNKALNLVEQREFKGGRQVRLSSQVKSFPNAIDVYKVVPKVYKLKVNDEINWIGLEINEQIRKDITETALQLTGSKYGWKNIFKIVRGYTPVLRLTYNKYDEVDRTDVYVCSTLVSYTYKIHYADPCPIIPDDLTSPNDLARSPLFKYAFTIGEMDLERNY